MAYLLKNTRFGFQSLVSVDLLTDFISNRLGWEYNYNEPNIHLPLKGIIGEGIFYKIPMYQYRQTIYQTLYGNLTGHCPSRSEYTYVHMTV